MKNKIINVLVMLTYVGIYKLLGFELTLIIMMSDFYYSWYNKNKT